MTKVSPSYRQEQLDSGEVTLVDVYADIVTSCVFRFADIIANTEHSGIAVLTLTTAVFEPLGGILRGGNPRDMRKNFIEGFDYLFQQARGSTLAERVYYFVRCGLFHEGFIKPGICLKKSDEDEAIAERDGSVIIDPPMFLHEIKKQFEVFVDSVRTDGGLRRNFETYWRLRDENHEEQQRKHWPTAAAQPQALTGTTTISPHSGSTTLETGTGWVSVKGHSEEA
jgi:hypothetical protein